VSLWRTRFVLTWPLGPFCRVCMALLFIYNSIITTFIIFWPLLASPIHLLLPCSGLRGHNFEICRLVRQIFIHLSQLDLFTLLDLPWPSCRLLILLWAVNSKKSGEIRSPDGDLRVRWTALLDFSYLAGKPLRIDDLAYTLAKQSILWTAETDN
jgi:hypothetical protein